jgi:hypothetical protein
LAIGVPTTLLYLQSNRLLEREVLVAEADIVPRFEIAIARESDVLEADMTDARAFGWLLVRNRGGQAYDVQLTFDDCIDVRLSPACGDRGPWYRVLIPCIYYAQRTPQGPDPDVIVFAAPPAFVQERVRGACIYAWENDATGRLADESCVSMYTRVRSLITVTCSDKVGRRYVRRYVVESNFSGDSYETQASDVASALRPDFSQKVTSVGIAELQLALDRVATPRDPSNCICDVFALTGEQFRRLVNEFIDTTELEKGFRG